MLKKLRVKFIAINMMTVFVMLLVMFGAVYQIVASRLEEQRFSAMREIASTPRVLHNIFDKRSEINFPYFTIDVDAFGAVVAGEGQYFELPDADLLLDLYSRAASSGARSGIVEEYSLGFYRAVSPMGERIVFADISGIKTTLSWLLRGLVSIGVASLGLFFAISFFLARWAVKPVDKAWQQQRQFVADASHELKTPLAVIMANAQLLSAPDRTEPEKSRFADNILATSYKMRELIERLLDLARADNAPEKTAFAPLDLSRLVSDALLPFEPVYFERGLALHSEICDNISLSGSAAHLKQLVDILLDNAQKYSAVPGEVNITLSMHDRGKCLLTVSNPGEPMTREELKNIFKRFYRLDSSRTGGEQGGYGLGLSIAESVAKEHGGKIWAESADGLISFKVLLPAHETHSA